MARFLKRLLVWLLEDLHNRLIYSSSPLRFPVVLWTDSPDPPKPDPAVGEASKESVELAKEQWNYYKTTQAPLMMRIMEEVTGQQIGMTDDQRTRANEQWLMYNTLFAPVEQRMVLDSFGYSYMPEADAEKLLTQMTDSQKSMLQNQYDKDLAGIAEAESRAQSLGNTETTTTTTTNKDRQRGGRAANSQALDWNPNWKLFNNRGADTSTTTTEETTTSTSKDGGSQLDQAYFDAQRQSLLEEKQRREQQIDSNADLIRGSREAEQAAINTEAGRARADVSRAYDANRGIIRREMGRMGVDPNAGRFQAIDRANNARAAADEAGAGTGTRLGLIEQMQAKRGGVANFGRNMPNTAGQTSGIALNAGNSAVGNTNQTIGTSASASTAGAPWMNAGISGLNQQYQNQLAAYNANDNSGMWGLVGTGVGSLLSNPGIFSVSSKDKKTRKKKVDHRGILAKVRGLPVEEWEYKDGVQRTPGMADTDPDDRHIGPYAEDMKETFGVGDGKTIHPADQGGIILSAIKALAQKVDNLEKRAA